MTIDDLVVTKNHKLKTSYTPVTECKHLWRSTQCNTSSSHPVLTTQESTDIWEHAHIPSHTQRVNHNLYAQTLPEDSKRELLSVVKTAYTHWETEVFQAIAKAFTGKLRREKWNTLVTWVLSFLEGCPLSSGTLQFWKGWHCLLLSIPSNQPTLSSELWIKLINYRSRTLGFMLHSSGLYTGCVRHYSLKVS